MSTWKQYGYRDAAYVLVARIGKDDDGETGQDRDDALVGHNANIALETHVIALCKVVDNQDNKITNGYESDDAGVLERVESAEKR